MQEQPFRLWTKDFTCIVAANFFYFGSFYFLIPTMPQYVAGLGGRPDQVGLVMGCFTLAAVLLRPYFGRLSDRRGRKPFLVGGALAFCLFPILYAVLHNVTLLYVVRLLHGVAHACFLAGSSAYIADYAPPARRGEIIGIYGVSNVLAMALFPAVGSALVSDNAPFARLFFWAAVAAVAGFVAVLPLREYQTAAARLAVPVPLAVIARQRVVLVPALTLLAGATAYGAVITFLPLYAPERGISDFGVFFTVYAASTLLSRVLVGKMSDRVGRSRLILPFLLLVGIAVFLLPLLQSTALLGVIAMAFGLGFGAFMPTLQALVVDHVAPAQRGSALAFFTSFMDIGITVGAVLMGAVGTLWGFAVMFAVTGAVALSGVLLFWQQRGIFRS